MGRAGLVSLVEDLRSLVDCKTSAAKTSFLVPRWDPPPVHPAFTALRGTATCSYLSAPEGIPNPAALKQKKVGREKKKQE